MSGTYAASDHSAANTACEHDVTNSPFTISATSPGATENSSSHITNPCLSEYRCRPARLSLASSNTRSHRVDQRHLPATHPRPHLNRPCEGARLHCLKPPALTLRRLTRHPSVTHPERIVFGHLKHQSSTPQSSEHVCPGR